jgi:hypothetical protein
MRIYFYADDSDVLDLIQKIFATLKLKFYKNSWFEGDTNYTFEDELNLSQRMSSLSTLNMYFVCEKKAVLKTKQLRVRSGRLTHSIDFGVMPDSVRFFLGTRVSEPKLIQSTIDGFCDTEVSKSLFKSLKKLVVENSKKVGAAYVFSGAEEKYNSGWSLTPTEGASKKLHLIL